jgi:uncharacterized protein
MITVFADTSYWIAFLNEDDDLYEIAIQTTETLFPMQIVTSEMVLSELLNHVSKKVRISEMLPLTSSINSMKIQTW